MKFKILFFLILIIFSCNNNESLKTDNSLVYTIKEFDLDKKQLIIDNQ